MDFHQWDSYGFLPGKATRWLTSFWKQVREICFEVIDSFCESIRVSIDLISIGDATFRVYLA